MSLISNIISLFNIEVMVNSITNAEPFVTQYILNKTITSDFTLGFEYLNRIILKLFFISPDKIFNVESFYDSFTNRFFPGIDYGIAYNIFSEPYAIAGMIGVVIFIIIFGCILNFIDNMIRSNNSMLSSLGLSLSSIYTFYIFRNSIENIILWTQILVLIFTVCYVFQLIKYKMKIYYN